MFCCHQRLSVPAYNFSLFTDALQAGNLLGAIADPISADFALIPFALGCGVAVPVVEALATTVTEFANLIP